MGAGGSFDEMGLGGDLQPFDPPLNHDAVLPLAGNFSA